MWMAHARRGSTPRATRKSCGFPRWHAFRGRPPDVHGWSANAARSAKRLEIPVAAPGMPLAQIAGMKKTAPRKLKLERETLRALRTDQLDAARGGWWTQACPGAIWKAITSYAPSGGDDTSNSVSGVR